MNYLIKWRNLWNANTDYAKWERVAPDKVREFITRHNGPQNLAITLKLLAAGDEVRFPTFAIRCAPESVTARVSEKQAKTLPAEPATGGKLGDRLFTAEEISTAGDAALDLFDTLVRGILGVVVRHADREADPVARAHVLRCGLETSADSLVSANIELIK